MKTGVAKDRAWAQLHAERLNGAIQILVINGVFVVPNVSGRVRHLVSNEEDSIITGIRLKLSDGGACPRCNRRLCPHRRANSRKREVACATNCKLSIGSILKHVALPRMLLAPGVFVWSDILCFAKIRRAGIQGCVQIVNVNAEPVRYGVMIMSGVIIRVGWKRACKRIHPCARTDLVLIGVKSCRIRI